MYLRHTCDILIVGCPSFDIDGYKTFVFSMAFAKGPGECACYIQQHQRFLQAGSRMDDSQQSHEAEGPLNQCGKLKLDDCPMVFLRAHVEARARDIS